ncbi:class II aldolase/adducin family protein [Georgenia thermotolerans]|uniref:class II aldolase/adducin family protein n=1 Tax=Georgenia thermotolerans TaxID=527326 RepID=UPI001478A801|nr:class II aldolase/adducin family protein [Georgenia thermotolerans]
MPELITAGVRDRWDDAVPTGDALDQCVYVSRLLGSDPAVVLHGGGNTSVKTLDRDVTGEPIELVHVKASGHDLGRITRAGFAPLRLDRLRRLAALPALDDTTMVNEFRCASIDAAAPTASIEALLHALLPFRFVLHSHADAVVTLTDTELPDADLLEVFGHDALVLPYCRPGFDLARRVAQELAARDGAPPSAVVLRNHGLFTFADEAKDAYQRHIRLINAAEERIARSRGGAAHAPRPGTPAVAAPAVAGVGDDHGEALAALRAEIGRAAGFPVLVRAEKDPEVDAFLALDNLATVTRNGTATLEHVIRTKPWPLIGRDVAAFVREYRARFERFAPSYPEGLTALDPAPRVVLDAELGLVTVGRTPGELGAVRDIYRHTMRIIRDAEALGGYRSVGDADLFDIEYWELEQAKLRRSGERPPLEGQVAVVTAAQGEDAEPVRAALADAGAQVVTGGHQAQAISEAVASWGGVDLLCHVGVAPAAAYRRHRVLRHGWAGGVEIVLSADPDGCTVVGPRGRVRAALADVESLRAALLLVARSAWSESAGPTRR